VQEPYTLDEQEERLGNEELAVEYDLAETADEIELAAKLRQRNAVLREKKMQLYELNRERWTEGGGPCKLDFERADRDVLLSELRQLMAQAEDG
jgi:uncharacterized lipoprotein YmbA